MTADALGPVPSDGDDATPLTDAQRALRASILATEHWSLLASRSTTQSEVLTRIAIFLTLVSVGLFALGVMGNATQFQGWFGVAALGVLLLLVVLGMITQERVYNSSAEDMVYVIAMNRLRGAYVDLDAGVERYLVTSPADDTTGIGRTYFPFPRSDASHFFASSMMLMFVVETVLAGLFVGSLTYALSESIGWSIGAGVAGAIASAAFWMRRGYRSYSTIQRGHSPLRRTVAPATQGEDGSESTRPTAYAPGTGASVSPEPATPTPSAAAPLHHNPASPTPEPAAAEPHESEANGDPPLRRSRRRSD